MALSQSIAVWADTTATAAQKLEAAGGLIPIVGNVIGLGEGISHRDPETVAVNTIALASVVIAQAVPVVGEIVDLAAAGLHGSAGAGQLLPPTQRSGQAVHQELHDRAPEPAAARPGGCVVRVDGAPRCLLPWWSELPPPCAPPSSAGGPILLPSPTTPSGSSPVRPPSDRIATPSATGRPAGSAGTGGSPPTVERPPDKMMSHQMVVRFPCRRPG